MNTERLNTAPKRDGESYAESEDRRPSFADLLAALVNQTSGLVRDEIALAKAEAIQKLHRLRSALALAGVSIALALLSGMSLIAAIIIALAPKLGAAWSSAIVGLVLGLIAIFLAARGLRQLRRLG